MSSKLVRELCDAAGVPLETSLESLVERILQTQDLGSIVPTPLALLMVVKADEEGGKSVALTQLIPLMIKFR